MNYFNYIGRSLRKKGLGMVGDDRSQQWHHVFAITKKKNIKIKNQPYIFLELAFAEKIKSSIVLPKHYLP